MIAIFIAEKYIFVPTKNIGCCLTDLCWFISWCLQQNGDE